MRFEWLLRCTVPQSWDFCVFGTTWLRTQSRPPPFTLAEEETKQGNIGLTAFGDHLEDLREKWRGREVRGGSGRLFRVDANGLLGGAGVHAGLPEAARGALAEAK